MITYIASFPRSGNTWLRNIINQNFGLLSTEDSHVREENVEVVENWKAFERKHRSMCRSLWDPQSDISDEEIWSIEELRAWFAKRDERQLDIIHNGSQMIFKYPAIRRFIAGRKQQYFIKTHKRPYAVIFPGEKSITLVRHPGAVFWSYYNYQRDVVKNQGISLLKCILGRTPGGDWSKYYASWLKAEGKFPITFIRYEDMVNDIHEVIDKLGEVIGIKPISKDVKPFEKYQKERPDFYREGKVSGWEDNYGFVEKNLLLRHKKVMSEFGYKSVKRFVM